MIVFDLNCGGDHQFEAWFRSSADYAEQLAHGEIACPYCGDRNVSKAVTAANVGAKGNQRDNSRAGRTTLSPDNMPADIAPGDIAPGDNVLGGGPSMGLKALPKPLRDELARTLKKVRDHVEKSCDYVGDDFPEEARKIYYGESKPRGIFGEATPEESAELSDEGIEIMPLPGLRKRRPSDA